MDNSLLIHKANIIVHIIAGSIALLLGLVAIMTKKGGKNHRRSGTIFMMLLIVVIFTGFIGVFVFGRNTFLLVITVLSGYFGFSGYRILQTKSNRPQLVDVCIGIGSVIAVAYFLYYFKSIGMIWSPLIIYSTVGTLLLVISYDFIRYFIPVSRYGNLWFYEHIFKMIGAFTALLSAFSGTVFSNYQPYSQFLPSVFGTGLQIGFIVYYYRKNRRQARLLPVHQ